jgi:hypothetical protein
VRKQFTGGRPFGTVRERQYLSPSTKFMNEHSWLVSRERIASTVPTVVVATVDAVDSVIGSRPQPVSSSSASSGNRRTQFMMRLCQQRG